MNQQLLHSIARLLLAAMVPLIVQQIADGRDIYSLDWRALTSGTIVALLIAAYNYYNPRDTRFGRGCPHNPTPPQSPKPHQTTNQHD